jgi:hypothetical protein
VPRPLVLPAGALVESAVFPGRLPALARDRPGSSNKRLQPTSCVVYAWRTMDNGRG